MTTKISGAFGLNSTQRHRSCCVLFIAQITTQVCSASSSPIFAAVRDVYSVIMHAIFSWRSVKWFQVSEWVEFGVVRRCRDPRYTLLFPWGDTKGIPALGRRRWWAVKYLSTLRVSWKYMRKLRWQRKFSALLDWFILSGIVLVAFCSLLKSRLKSVQRRRRRRRCLQQPITVRKPCATRRYAFRHFHTWKKYAFRHTIDK